MTAAKGGAPARTLTPAQLDVAQSPTAADLVGAVLTGLVERHMHNADASGLGPMHDTAKRALTRHIGQLGRLHADETARAGE